METKSYIENIKHLFFGLFIISSILLNSCGSPKNTVHFDNEEPIEINYRQNESYIIIENVILNNSPIARNLIFDTGANGTVIDKSIAENLNLKTIKKVRLVDITGKKTRVPCVKIDSMNIGGAVFKDIYALVTDLSAFNCKNVQVIIGNNVLKTGIWKIDLSKHRITLYNSNKHFDYSNYHKIPFSYRLNLIKLKLEYSGKKLKNILFDTGNPSILILSQKDKLTEHLKPEYSFELFYQSLNKIQPEKVRRDYYFSNIKLYSLELDSVLTKYSRKRSIGLGLFKNNTIVIDYKHKLIGIKEPFILKKPTFKNVGITFKSYNNNEIIISNLRLNSPADKVGIGVGDKVQKINNTEISEFLLTECELIDSLNSMTNDTLYLKLENWNSSRQLIPYQYCRVGKGESHP